MGFTEAVRTVLREKYATFQGRALRSEFWWFALFIILVEILMVGVLALATNGFQDFETGTIGGFAIFLMIVFGIFGLFIFIPTIAVTVRRFHDVNLSGWWYLGLTLAGIIPFVGFVASIATFVITVLKGTDGPNKFGPDPKNPIANVDTFT